MIFPFRWLWKQLNGYQITAISKALFQWFKDMFDPLLDYWNNLKIENAKGNHLTIIGMMSGFLRPNIEIAAQGYQYFTDGPYHGQPYGVSDLDGDLSYGGKFTDLSEQLYKDRYKLAAEYYRKILTAALSNGNGCINGLVSLDDTMEAIWKCYRSDDVGYMFSFVQEPYSNRTYGDVEIQLGSNTSWGVHLNEAIGIIYALRDTVYYPQPKLIIMSSEDGSPLETEDSHNINTEQNKVTTGVLQVEFKTEDN